MIFEHKVSKGGRFNQIYIPKEMESVFEVGDVVEVKLLKKKTSAYYSKNLNKLGEFKEKLIKDIFSFLAILSEVEQVFIVGSFLTEKTDYHDIDLIIITNKKGKDIEEKIYNQLIEKFQLKFHIMAIQKELFYNLIKICPLTRNMLYYYVSNRKFDALPKLDLDKNHIKFLLMMPEDLLNINVNSRSFYDNLRRLITINNFLESGELSPIQINFNLKSLTGDFLYSQLKNNEPIDKKTLKHLREIIKKQLNKIQENI